MQVKKFEARTIKEAIELVKFHMGPDAIILSAKDNGKNFGLLGESSVEVTAAISESRLQRKKVAEKKLDSQSIKKFQSASAKMQKEFINKVFSQKNDESEDMNYEMTESPEKPAAPAPPAPVSKRNGITAHRYIDIEESSDLATFTESAKEQYNSSELTRPIARQVPLVSPYAQKPNVVQTTGANVQVANLQNEIAYLKNMLSRFQNMPQNFVSMHPGAEDGIPYELSFTFKKLLDAGLAHKNIVPILRHANEILPTEHKKKKAFVDGWVIKYLLENIKINDKPLRSKYQIFVGPTGQGKTSTVVKMACHLVMNEKKKIAILSGDYVKIGANDQIKIYAQILNVPCAAISLNEDWAVLQKKLESFDYVLIDTPGVNLKNSQELNVLKAVLPPSLEGMDVHYVQSAMARDVDAFEVARRFKIIGFQDVIFTRLDEAVQHGIIYNFQKEFSVPLHSFGIGNAIPEDYEFASKERVVDLFFHLSKIKKERGTT